jgi:hypothetical protein
VNSAKARTLFCSSRPAPPLPTQQRSVSLILVTRAASLPAWRNLELPWPRQRKTWSLPWLRRSAAPGPATHRCCLYEWRLRLSGSPCRLVPPRPSSRSVRRRSLSPVAAYEVYPLARRSTCVGRFPTLRRAIPPALRQRGTAPSRQLRAAQPSPRRLSQPGPTRRRVCTGRPASVQLYRMTSESLF